MAASLWTRTRCGSRSSWRRRASARPSGGRGRTGWVAPEIRLTLDSQPRRNAATGVPMQVTEIPDPSRGQPRSWDAVRPPGRPGTIPVTVRLDPPRYDPLKRLVQRLQTTGQSILQTALDRSMVTLERERAPRPGIRGSEHAVRGGDPGSGAEAAAAGQLRLRPARADHRADLPRQRADAPLAAPLCRRARDPHPGAHNRSPDGHTRAGLIRVGLHRICQSKGVDLENNAVLGTG